MYRFLSPFLLLLLVMGLPLSSTVMRVHAAGAPQLVLSADVASAAGGSLLSVSGSGFTPGSTVTIMFDAAPLGASPVTSQGYFGPTQVTIPVSVPGQHIIKASGAGLPTLSAAETIAIPASISAGTHQIRVMQGSQVVVAATLIVSVPAHGSIGLTPATDPTGSHVTVTGTGFQPGEQVQISLNGALLTTTQTSAQGQITVSVLLPQTFTAGVAAILATGLTSHTTATANFTVAAGLTVSPSSVAAGGTVAVSATGFQPGELVQDAAIATIIQSDQPIVAERAMYFGAPNGSTTGGTDIFGQSTPARGWAFATGNTQSGSAEFELLFNPNTTASTVLATFYADNGQMVQQTFTVNVHSRLNIDLNLSVPGLPHGAHGLVLISSNGVPFFAEQAIYTNNMGNGSASIGTPIQ